MVLISGYEMAMENYMNDAGNWFALIAAIAAIVGVIIAGWALYIQLANVNEKHQNEFLDIFCQYSWGNEGDINSTDRIFLRIEVEKANGKGNFSGLLGTPYLEASHDEDENAFSIRGTVNEKGISIITISRRVGWRESPFGKAKLAYNKTTGYLVFSSLSFEENLSEREKKLTELNVTLFNHSK